MAAIVNVRRDISPLIRQPGDELLAHLPGRDRIAAARGDQNFAPRQFCIWFGLPCHQRMEQTDAVKQIRALEKHRRQDVGPVRIAEGKNRTACMLGAMRLDKRDHLVGCTRQIIHVVHAFASTAEKAGSAHFGHVPPGGDNPGPGGKMLRDLEQLMLVPTGAVKGKHQWLVSIWSAIERWV